MSNQDCVILNGTRGTILTAPAASCTLLSPVRQDLKPNALYYDTTTKEVTYDVVSGGGGGTTFGTQIAIGTGSGVGQGASTVAIGNTAASYNQGANSVAIGLNSGGASPNAQGADAVAIGNSAGKGQGHYSVAIGNAAGSTGQGSLAVAIGNKAGETSQAAQSIVINAASAALNTANTGLYIKPIREFYSDSTYRLGYDGTTGEISRQFSSITQLWSNTTLNGITPSTGIYSSTFVVPTASNLTLSGDFAYGTGTGQTVTFNITLIRQSDSAVVATLVRTTAVWGSGSPGMYPNVPVNEVIKNVGAATYAIRIYLVSGTSILWNANTVVSMVLRIN
jgi:hypothetical protein